MARMKDLVTDVNFALVSTGITYFRHGAKQQSEKFYQYEGTNGAVIKFCAHPTKPWCFKILEGTNGLGNLCATRLTNAFTAAIAKHETINNLSIE